MSAIKDFFVRNHVVITLVSLIGGAHYMWYRLQFNDALRSPYEREHDPIIKNVENMKKIIKEKIP